MENRLKSFLEGMKSGEKLPKKNQLLILLLTGILLLVIVVPLPEETEEDSTAAVEAGAGNGTGTDAQDYEGYLEERTAEALRQVDGGWRSGSYDHAEFHRAESGGEGPAELQPDYGGSRQFRRYKDHRGQFVGQDQRL